MGIALWHSGRIVAHHDPRACKKYPEPYVEIIRTGVPMQNRDIQCLLELEADPACLFLKVVADDQRTIQCPISSRCLVLPEANLHCVKYMTNSGSRSS